MWKQIPVYNVETDTGIMWNCWYRAGGAQELCESRGDDDEVMLNVLGCRLTY